jgi:hypothetical protein
MGAAAQPHHGEEDQMTAGKSRPTPRQLRYLRQLAELTGTTFTRPATRRQASREIERLSQRSRSSRHERRDDRKTVSRGLADDRPASSVRPEEITGYGSDCRWR